jgi:hypothetical protein
MKKAIQIDEIDNVATVTSDVLKDESVEVLSHEGEVVRRLKTLNDIPFGHKIAKRNLKIHGIIVKYGETIGIASRDIKEGEWVHTHNVESVTVPTSSFEMASK